MPIRKNECIKLMTNLKFHQETLLNASEHKIQKNECIKLMSNLKFHRETLFNASEHKIQKNECIKFMCNLNTVVPASIKLRKTNVSSWWITWNFTEKHFIMPASIKFRKTYVSSCLLASSALRYRFLSPTIGVVGSNFYFYVPSANLIALPIVYGKCLQYIVLKNSITNLLLFSYINLITELKTVQRFVSKKKFKT